MIFYPNVPQGRRFAFAISVPPSAPRAPKQRGILTDGVGYESKEPSVDLVTPTNLARWQKDGFPTPVQLGSESAKNQLFSISPAAPSGETLKNKEYQ